MLIHLISHTKYLDSDKAVTVCIHGILIIKATKRGGKLATVGRGAQEIMVPLFPASSKEVDIIGVFRYSNL